MSSENDPLRDTAAKQVDYFAQDFLQRFGIKEEEVPDFVENLRWLINRRKRMDTVVGGVLITIFGAGGVMTLYAIIEGIQHYLGIHK